MRLTEATTWFSITLGAAVSGITFWLAFRRLHVKRRRKFSPDEWQSIGTLKVINFYPVKSGAPIRLQQVECSEFGLHANGFWERCLLAYDECGAIVFAGSYPRMLSIQPVIVGEGVLRLDAPNMPPLTMDFNELLREPYTVVEKRKNGNIKRLVECRAEHSEWLSRAILQRDRGLRLYVKLKPQVPEALDIFPAMVLHERSVHDLNERLSGRTGVVDCQQFRGNLVVDSNANVPPYNEDNWLWLKIGNDADRSTILCYNSDCLRCILVNVNVQDYTRNPNFEPLKELKKYRLRMDHKEPSMGVYFDVYRSGLWKIGDRIYVQNK